MGISFSSDSISGFGTGYGDNVIDISGAGSSTQQNTIDWKTTSDSVRDGLTRTTTVLTDLRKAVDAFRKVDDPIPAQVSQQAQRLDVFARSIPWDLLIVAGIGFVLFKAAKKA